MASFFSAAAPAAAPPRRATAPPPEGEGERDRLSSIIIQLSRTEVGGLTRRPRRRKHETRAVVEQVRADGSWKRESALAIACGSPRKSPDPAAKSLESDGRLRSPKWPSRAKLPAENRACWFGQSDSIRKQSSGRNALTKCYAFWSVAPFAAPVSFPPPLPRVLPKRGKSETLSLRESSSTFWVPSHQNAQNYESNHIQLRQPRLVILDARESYHLSPTPLQVAPALGLDPIGQARPARLPSSSNVFHAADGFPVGLEKFSCHPHPPPLAPHSPFHFDLVVVVAAVVGGGGSVGAARELARASSFAVGSGSTSTPAGGNSSGGTTATYGAIGSPDKASSPSSSSSLEPRRWERRETGAAQRPSRVLFRG